MLTTQEDHITVLDRTGRFDVVSSVAFCPDGMHLPSGSGDGIRRWRLADEVDKQLGMGINSICVSKDCRWIVCRTTQGASLWEEKIQEKAIEVEGANKAVAVDASPDATRFATGTGHDDTSIWNIVTSERLVGPLQHDTYVVGVKFSPNGERAARTRLVASSTVTLATSSSRFTILKANSQSPWLAITPIVWSNNAQQISASGDDSKITAFDSSTRSQLAESQVRDDGEVLSIALAVNGKFLSTFAYDSVSFWDASTLAQISPPIEDGERIRSMTHSRLQPCCYWKI